MWQELAVPYNLWPMARVRWNFNKARRVLPKREASVILYSTKALHDDWLFAGPDHIPSESHTENCSDEELLKLLEEVDLRSLAEREPEGLDAFGDWDSTLSGGEKQRLAMTRLFYHAPQYALLDECTSAVSLEAEAVIYETAKRKGITLLTITHRVPRLENTTSYCYASTEKAAGCLARWTRTAQRF